VRWQRISLPPIAPAVTYRVCHHTRASWQFPFLAIVVLAVAAFSSSTLIDWLPFVIIMILHIALFVRDSMPALSSLQSSRPLIQRSPGQDVNLLHPQYRTPVSVVERTHELFPILDYTVTMPS
jgi:hypothetical protein